MTHRLTQTKHAMQAVKEPDNHNTLHLQLGADPLPPIIHHSHKSCSRQHYSSVHRLCCGRETQATSWCPVPPNMVWHMKLHLTHSYPAATLVPPQRLSGTKLWALTVWPLGQRAGSLPPDLTVAKHKAPTRQGVMVRHSQGVTPHP